MFFGIICYHQFPLADDSRRSLAFSWWTKLHNNSLDRSRSIAECGFWIADLKSRRTVNSDVVPLSILMNARATAAATLLLLITFAVVHAQDLPPAPAADFVPEQWKEFVSNEGGFKVRMPGVPSEVFQPVESKPGTTVGHFYSLITKTAEYAVGYATFARDLETFQPSKLTLDGIRDRTLAKESGKLLSELDITAAGHPGRALVLEVSDGIFRDRYFLVGNRLYTVTVFTLKVKARSDADTEGIRKAQESVANRFLDSFNLLTK